MSPRPKLNMPLKEHNMSPRSQWISNVSLLKHQLKDDGELVAIVPKKSSTKTTTTTTTTPETRTKMSWNELEAQLSKRKRDGILPSVVNTTSLPSNKNNRNSSTYNNPLSPTTESLNLTYPRQLSPTRKTSAVTATTKKTPILSGATPTIANKRPVLNIPSSSSGITHLSPKSKDMLKQVHNGTAKLPTTTTTYNGTSNDKATTIRSNNENTTLAPSTTITNVARVNKQQQQQSYHTTEHASHSNTYINRNNKGMPSPMEQSQQVQHYNENSTKKAMEKPMNVEVIREYVQQQQQQHPNEVVERNPSRNVQPSTIPDTIKPYNGVANNSSDLKQVHHHQQQQIQLEPPQQVNKNLVQSQTPSQKVPRPVKTTKTNGSLSWLRRSMKPLKNSVRLNNTMTQVSLLTTDTALSIKSSTSKNNHRLSKSSSSKSHRSTKSNNKVIEKYFHPTTPLQLGLWVSEVKKVIRLAQREEGIFHQQQHQRNLQELIKPTKMNALSSPSSKHNTTKSPKHQEQFQQQSEHEQRDYVASYDETFLLQANQSYGTRTINTREGGQYNPNNNGEDVYYHKNREIGVYVDYSTFDDGDSVSSIELLFKWLTCRDLNEPTTSNNNTCGGGATITTTGTTTNEENGQRRIMQRGAPPDTVIATESNVSDDLSIDLDAPRTPRTFFSR